MRTVQFLLLTGMTVFLCGACAGPSEIRVTGARYEAQTELTVPRDGETGGSAREAEGSSAEHPPADTDAAEGALSPVPAGTDIRVYVCGAVREPAVYALSPDARVCDAISAAGGFTDDADTQWLNQAQKLSDGQMLVVYTAEETARMEQQGVLRADGGSVPRTDASSAAPGKDMVNLNTASREELMTLPGIGESKADSIIRYREETGPFASPEDVMNISGIKDSVYSRMKDRITV